MARFMLNRRMTLILALAAFLVASPTAVRSSGIDGSQMDPGDPPSQPGESGDPDIPVGPSKGTAKGTQRLEAPRRGTRTEGDGRDSRSVEMLRLRIVLQTLRAIYLRF